MLNDQFGSNKCVLEVHLIKNNLEFLRLGARWGRKTEIFTGEGEEKEMFRLRSLGFWAFFFYKKTTDLNLLKTLSS